MKFLQSSVILLSLYYFNLLMKISVRNVLNYSHSDVDHENL
jgi:hypothetical protein